ncbi:hypothetical protein G5V57_04430 [Nordella sp. HKS 07]|uniref:hypothetical protein n=1 Tax=Nordella sp. HKS 07 TaxID=2712222 RepID=UPI0013E1B913|nr:hypothetical protein [Nordella sp. HKS 07]QIG47059.1 hypothetical protein G5V57_04430 [Nordella sp. HKS 07]
MVLQSPIQYAAGLNEVAAKALRNATDQNESRVVLTAALARLGSLEEAREEAKQYLATNPQYRIGRTTEFHPYRHMALRDRIAEDLRKAGLPE